MRMGKNHREEQKKESNKKKKTDRFSVVHESLMPQMIRRSVDILG